MAETIEELGKALATDEQALSTLLPELIQGSGRLGDVGRGLGLGAMKPREIWEKLIVQVKATENANVQVLLGFLSGLQTVHPKEVNAFLDEAIDHPVLGKWLPYLQTSVAIDAAGVRRLRETLELGRAQVGQFMALVYGGVCEPISGPDFRDLMLAIGAKPDGNRIALEILSMRLHSDSTAKREPLPETIEAGRALLDQYTFKRRGNQTDHDDYKLGVVASKCLIGPEGEPIARKLCRDFLAAADNHDVYPSELDDLLKVLFKRQPAVVLDELVIGDDKQRRKRIKLVHETMQHGRNPMAVLNDDVLLEWCKRDPGIRYPFAAGTALLFRRANDQAPHEWLPIAEKLLQNAPVPALVLKEYSSRLRPRSWSGSLASKYESRLQLLDKLNVSADPGLVAAFNEFRAELADTIEKQRINELHEDRAEGERFE
jgi:hypothetical protein